MLYDYLLLEIDSGIRRKSRAKAEDINSHVYMYVYNRVIPIIGITSRFDVGRDAGSVHDHFSGGQEAEWTKQFGKWCIARTKGKVRHAARAT